MITTFFTLLLLLLGSMFHLTYIKDFMPTAAILLGIVLILTIIFRILNYILFKTNKLDRYEKNWDDPIITIAEILYGALVCALVFKILWNYNNGFGYFDNTLILWGMLIGFDIAVVAIIFSTYSFNFKDSVRDSIMFQVSNVRTGLFFLMAFMAILKFTIVGFLLIVGIIGIFLGLFKK